MSFFTRFAFIPCRAPRETSENIDTVLADTIGRQFLWETGRKVKKRCTWLWHVKIHGGMVIMVGVWLIVEGRGYRDE